MIKKFFTTFFIKREISLHIRGKKKSFIEQLVYSIAVKLLKFEYNKQKVQELRDYRYAVNICGLKIIKRLDVAKIQELYFKCLEPNVSITSVVESCGFKTRQHRDKLENKDLSFPSTLNVNAQKTSNSDVPPVQPTPAKKVNKNKTNSTDEFMQRVSSMSDTTMVTPVVGFNKSVLSNNLADELAGKINLSYTDLSNKTYEIKCIYRNFTPFVDRYKSILLNREYIFDVKSLVDKSILDKRKDASYECHISRLSIMDKTILPSQYPYEDDYLFWLAASKKGNVIFDLTNTSDKLQPYYPLDESEFSCHLDDGSIITIESDQNPEEISKNSEADDIITVKKISAVDNFLGINSCSEITYKVTSDKDSSVKEKIVKRVHYAGWEDGTATKLDDLSKLAAHLRDKMADEGFPIVHCRAGVGRTGTLATAAYLIGLIKAGQLNQENMLDKINELILEERSQTNRHFVQRKEQYTLLVQFCLEKLKPLSQS